MNDDQKLAEKDAAKEVLVTTAKVGGFLVIVGIVVFLFFMIVLMSWMRNP
jgi:hypothetical protein